MPPRKRLPVGKRAPARHATNIRRIIRAHAPTISEHTAWLRALSSHGNWADSRSYNHIMGWWKSAHVDVFSRMHRFGTKNNNRLRIWDDGPGKGHFGSAMKENLERVGIHTHLVATTLDEKSIHRAERPFYDEVHGRSELFVPTKSFDFIFSNIGSMNYVHPLLRKEHLLKMAYSLTRGGQMFVAFYHRPLAERGEKRRSIAGSLLQKKPRNPLHVSEEMKAIERAFAKRKFLAKFHYLDLEEEIVGLHVVRK